VARSNRSDSMEEKACDIDVYNNQNYPKWNWKGKNTEICEGSLSDI
jgi:hypothetical protein